MPISRAPLRTLPIAVLAMLTCACSDAATRVAYDIQSGTRALGSREGARVEIPHVPRRWPEGCTGSYTLRIGKGAAIGDGLGNFRVQPDAQGLSVTCYGSSGNRNGWGTTYHLRFVDVPETVEINKQGGETTIIEVERKGGRAILVGLH